MAEISEEYLNITEPFEFDSSVSKIVYLSQDPRIGTDLNALTQTFITINPTDDWLLPSRSYLYVEGKLLQADGTQFTKDITGNWPDIALTSNFFPYLYNTLRYTINDIEVESFNYPGQCTTIKHLLTKPNYWNAADMGWMIDNFDGLSVRTDLIYYPVGIPSSSFATAAANPTAAEYRAAFLLIISTFNAVNSTAVADLTNLELPCAAASPTPAELMIGAKNIVSHINSAIDSMPILLPNANIFPNSSAVGMQTGLLTLLTIINNTITNRDYSGLKRNTGFIKRKNFVFNPLSNVMMDNQAGSFSLRIPLEHLFNFCENYSKVMYKCKHELQLNRQNDDYAIFKSGFLGTKGKVQLNLMRWYMPKITPNEKYTAMLYQQIKSGVEVDLAFMTKKIDYFNQLNGVNTYSVTLNYAAGTEKPRYIISAFQTSIPRTDSQNVNHSIFNGTGRNLSMIDVNFVNVYINGDNYQLMDYNNNFNENRMGRWYNEFKKFKMSYTNDFSENDMVSYEDFRNLYRLYVFDISKQSEVINNGIANVRLEFNFNSALPTAAETQIDLYCVSFFDRIWKLKSDGTKQYIIK